MRRHSEAREELARQERAIMELNAKIKEALDNTLEALKGYEPLIDRIDRIEKILLCQQCGGLGKRKVERLGIVQCPYCSGRGHNLREEE